jgi:excisionase family DNA binding protein
MKILNQRKKPKKDKDPRFRRLLTVEETATYLNIASSSIYNSIKEFPVKPLRLGRAIRFDIRDLDSYIEGLKNEG